MRLLCDSINVSRLERILCGLLTVRQANALTESECIYNSYQAWEFAAFIAGRPWCTADYVKHLELKLWITHKQSAYSMLLFCKHSFRNNYNCYALRISSSWQTFYKSVNKLQERLLHAEQNVKKHSCMFTSTHVSNLSDYLFGCLNGWFF